MLDPIRVERGNGDWAVIKPLSGKAWRISKRKRTREAQEDAATLLSLLPPDFFDRFTSRNEDEQKEAQRQLERLEYHRDNVDHPTVLRYGVESWSFGEIPEDCEDPSELIDNPATIWLVDEILEVTKPPSEGNSSAPSPRIDSEKAPLQAQPI